VAHRKTAISTANQSMASGIRLRWIR